MPREISSGAVQQLRSQGRIDLIGPKCGEVSHENESFLFFPCRVCVKHVSIFRLIFFLSFFLYTFLSPDSLSTLPSPSPRRPSPLPFIFHIMSATQQKPDHPKRKETHNNFFFLARHTNHPPKHQRHNQLLSEKQSYRPPTHLPDKQNVDIHPYAIVFPKTWTTSSQTTSYRAPSGVWRHWKDLQMDIGQPWDNTSLT